MKTKVFWLFEYGSLLLRLLVWILVTGLLRPRRCLISKLLPNKHRVLNLHKTPTKYLYTAYFPISATPPWCLSAIANILMSSYDELSIPPSRAQLDYVSECRQTMRIRSLLRYATFLD
jgi:hypothetical protein